MPSKIFSVSLGGLNCDLIEVEADISRGLSSFTIVGLGDTSVQESKERVRSAIKNSQFHFPIERKTINLAPAQLKKQGPSFDLPIAISLLVASGQLSLDRFEDSIIIGELALNGDLKPIKGVLPIVNFAKEQNLKKVFLPYQNINEASLSEGIELFGIKSLKELKAFCFGELSIAAVYGKGIPIESLEQEHQENDISLSSIYGLEDAKRALIIAAAGGHNLLMRGQPGTGKTVLARAFRSILPPLTPLEAAEVTKIYSVSHGLQNDQPLVTQRPFREVHHTASKVAIVGGGSKLKPGEITLSHNGVLFMDEITEFPRDTLETLRQPLEDGYINISRNRGTVRFPAKFILLAAMNNCPCGSAEGARAPSPSSSCTCTPKQIKAYQSRLSGPILDRFDITITTPKISIKNFLEDEEVSKEKEIKEIIKNARLIQASRYKDANIKENSSLSAKQIKEFCNIDPKAKTILDKAAKALNLSNRGYLKVIKVAQTIADLSKASGHSNTLTITEDYILESIQYRQQQT